MNKQVKLGLNEEKVSSHIIGHMDEDKIYYNRDH
jgi:hypothetical protein